MVNLLSLTEATQVKHSPNTKNENNLPSRVLPKPSHKRAGSTQQTNKTYGVADRAPFKENKSCPLSRDQEEEEERVFGKARVLLQASIYQVFCMLNIYGGRGVPLDEAGSDGGDVALKVLFSSQHQSITSAACRFQGTFQSYLPPGGKDEQIKCGFIPPPILVRSWVPSGPFATTALAYTTGPWINTSHPRKGVILATDPEFFRRRKREKRDRDTQEA
ncbi:hypothetical protein M426DRAFT_25820 [Hypoxylon sp. CI-4A]|nr:hypothetical protein M426DRAFT_25820 [Hypoxylon sp. CI-4A]